MNLIEMMKRESWKYIYDLNNKAADYNCFVVMSEFTGGKIDLNQKTLLERNDVILLIPLVVLNITSIGNIQLLLEIINSDFRTYDLNKLPTTFYTSENVEAELIENKLSLSFKLKEKYIKKIIYMSDNEKNVLNTVKNFSLVINDDSDSYITRVSLYKDMKGPCFPVKRISLKQKNIDKILDSAIKNISKLEKTIPTNLNMYLDCNGSSDYEVYQSTQSKESLPSIRNLSLGNNCYACAKKGITREHCSPKWMTDKYKVKPLIGNILCTKCNSWFGENYEIIAQDKLKIKNNQLFEEQRIFISKWCMKTAFTMSLASGVNVNPKWLFMLRNNKLPEDIEVYFDLRYKLGEQGFNYGVSRFNYVLSQKSTFLFTFICTDFTFVVIKTENKNLNNIPFIKMYPEYSVGHDNITFKNLADFHKDIHELISEEKTIDFSLPIRNQGKRI